jgi:hypothetical protein
MATILETPVDGTEAKVVQRDRVQQHLPGLLPNVDDLLIALVETSQRVGLAAEAVAKKQEEANELKAAQRGFEVARNSIVAQLAEQGVLIRDKRATETMKRVGEPMKPSDAAKTQDDAGNFKRIPSEGNPLFCVCGELMALSDRPHQTAHGKWAASQTANAASNGKASPAGKRTRAKRATSPTKPRRKK